MAPLIEDELLDHIGKRIKFFRKKKGLTVTELAHMLYLSPSTISKYECAKLSVDIRTLFKIADALGITIHQLLDYHQSVEPQTIENNSANFFNRSNIFYMYQYWGIDKQIHACVFELLEDISKNQKKITVYYSCEDLENYVDSGYIYEGTMTCLDLVTYFYCKNLFNPSDVFTICAKSTFARETTTTGVLLTLSSTLRNPYATKVIFSLYPLKQDSNLRSLLDISDKDSLKEIKRVNSLVVY